MNIAILAKNFAEKLGIHGVGIDFLKDKNSKMRYWELEEPPLIVKLD